MIRGLIIVLLALNVITAAMAAPVHCIYVSPNGSNASSGTIPETQKGVKNGPFATLHHAQQVAQKLLSEDKSRSVRIYVRGGSYTLREPLIFTENDAGSAENATQWIAYGTEKPVIGFKGEGPALQFLDTSHFLFCGFELSNISSVGVLIENSNNIHFLKNTLHDIAMKGIDVNSSNDIRIAGNDIYDIGGVAVDMGRNNPEESQTHSNQLINNQIYRCGFKTLKTGFIIDIHGKNHRISNNRLFELPAYSIRIIGSGCEITENEFFHLASGVYLSHHDEGTSNNIHNNHFHDMQEHAIKFWGEYGADSPVSVNINNNLFNNMHAGAIAITEIRSEQNIANNIFVNAIPVFTGEIINSDNRVLDFQRNIIATFPTDNINSHMIYDFKGEILEGITIDHNFYDYAMDKNVVRWGNQKDNVTQYLSWPAWQAMGYEENSHTIPPSFIAPDLGDFEVRPDAIFVQDKKFTSFPTYRFGIYEDEFRASWPPVEVDVP